VEEGSEKTGGVNVDLSTVIALASMLIALALAASQLRKRYQDKRLAQKADLEKEFRAPAERDAIIIGGAKQVVDMLRASLTAADEETHMLRNRLAVLEKQVTERDDLIHDYAARLRHLEYEVARLSKGGA
jgi:hypothetical protein